VKILCIRSLDGMHTVGGAFVWTPLQNTSQNIPTDYAGSYVWRYRLFPNTDDSTTVAPYNHQFYWLDAPVKFSPGVCASDNYALMSKGDYEVLVDSASNAQLIVFGLIMVIFVIGVVLGFSMTKVKHRYSGDV